MSNTASSTGDQRISRLESLIGACAVAGGALTLAVALLAATSVLMRWLFSSPIDGDFEYVKMATAIAVFSYLPYTQIRRGNIMVDTFTQWLPQGAVNAIDAFWDIVFSAVMAYLAYCLVHGTLSAFHSGETTMQRQLPIWPSIGLCAALAGLVAVSAFSTALRVVRATTARGPS
jgi:TRAP-type mannitol/chloroaromatic compound transport system permease small subunit